MAIFALVLGSVLGTVFGLFAFLVFDLAAWKAFVVYLLTAMSVGMVLIVTDMSRQSSKESEASRRAARSKEPKGSDTVRN